MTIPTLDSPRPGANADLNRVISDYLGCIEPSIDEIDAACSMPIRLVHNDAMGFGLEVGPYDLCGSDIERLRAAIAAYEEATGRSPHLNAAEYLRHPESGSDGE